MTTTSALIGSNHSQSHTGRQRPREPTSNNKLARQFSAGSNLISSKQAEMANLAPNLRLKSANLAPNKTIDGMIDEKFNELAKKILTELKEGDHSTREFFRALDEIIQAGRTSGGGGLGSPAGSERLRQAPRANCQNRSSFSQNQNSNRDQLRYQDNINQTGQQQRWPLEPSSQSHSLPAEVIPRSHSAALKFSPATTNTKIKDQISRLENLSGRPKTFVFNEHSGRNYAIRKSATTANCNSSSAQADLAKRPPESLELKSSRKRSMENQLSKKQRLVELYKQRIQYRPPGSDDDQEDEDEEEDDDDDDDDDDSSSRFLDDEEDLRDLNEQEDTDDMEVERYLARRRPAGSRKQPLERRRLTAPRSASKAAERALSPAARQRERPETNQQQFKTSSPKRSPASSNVQKQQLPLANSIARSNTIANAEYLNLPNKAQPAATANAQPAASRQAKRLDIGQLYKPHMNYSTSLLGNHRLSDDDEIIIIPTQSPSLLSISSADGNQTSAAEQADLEQIERFSISRTKSFWEKLSKGSKRNSPGDEQQHNSSAAGNKTASPNTTSTTLDETSGYSTLNGAPGNKLIGVRLNGHAHPSSTGLAQEHSPHSLAGYQAGSRAKFNYNSDEHYQSASTRRQPAGLSHAQQQQLRDDDDISRQNRFRQTR